MVSAVAFNTTLRSDVSAFFVVVVLVLMKLAGPFFSRVVQVYLRPLFFFVGNGELVTTKPAGKGRTRITGTRTAVCRSFRHMLPRFCFADSRDSNPYFRSFSIALSLYSMKASVNEEFPNKTISKNVLSYFLLRGYTHLKGEEKEENSIIFSD